MASFKITSVVASVMAISCGAALADQSSEKTNGIHPSVVTKTVSDGNIHVHTHIYYFSSQAEASQFSNSENAAQMKSKAESAAIASTGNLPNANKTVPSAVLTKPSSNSSTSASKYALSTSKPASAIESSHAGNGVTVANPSAVGTTPNLSSYLTSLHSHTNPELIGIAGHQATHPLTQPHQSPHTEVITAQEQIQKSQEIALRSSPVNDTQKTTPLEQTIQVQNTATQIPIPTVNATPMINDQETTRPELFGSAAAWGSSVFQSAKKVLKSIPQGIEKAVESARKSTQDSDPPSTKTQAKSSLANAGFPSESF